MTDDKNRQLEDCVQLDDVSCVDIDGREFERFPVVYVRKDDVGQPFSKIPYSASMVPPSLRSSSLHGPDDVYCLGACCFPRE